MSNHNYSQYSNKPNNQNRNFDNKPKTEPKPVMEEVKPVVETSEVIRPSLVQETVETKPVPETVKGTVVGCTKLNVRKSPSITGEVVAILSVDSDVEIDIQKSNFEWFHVCTAIGVEGYCMRKFINAHL